MWLGGLRISDQSDSALFPNPSLRQAVASSTPNKPARSAQTLLEGEDEEHPAIQDCASQPDRTQS